jgi:hypothetical protein
MHPHSEATLHSWTENMKYCIEKNTQLWYVGFCIWQKPTRRAKPIKVMHSQISMKNKTGRFTGKICKHNNKRDSLVKLTSHDFFTSSLKIGEMIPLTWRSENLLAGSSKPDHFRFVKSSCLSYLTHSTNQSQQSGILPLKNLIQKCVF